MNINNNQIISLIRWARDCNWKRKPLKKITHLMQMMTLTNYRDILNKIFTPTFQKLIAGHMIKKNMITSSQDEVIYKLSIEYQEKVYGTFYITRSNIDKMLNLLFATSDNKKPIQNLSYAQKFIIKKILSTWLMEIITETYFDPKKAQTFKFLQWEYIFEIVDKNALEERHVFYAHYTHETYQDLYLQIPFNSVIESEKTSTIQTVSLNEKIERSHKLLLDLKITHPVHKIQFMDHAMKLKIGESIPLWPIQDNIISMDNEEDAVHTKNTMAMTDLILSYNDQNMATGEWGHDKNKMIFLLKSFYKQYS